MDFSRYSSKLQKEQRQRAEKAKREAEKKAREKERAAKKVQEYEEQQRLARLERQRFEEEEALKYEAEREANKGVVLHLTRLRPVPYDAAAEKGILRSKDKITVPASARQALYAQGADSIAGPMFFGLVARGLDGTERRTHAAVMECSAAEGTLGLPPTVTALLGGDNIAWVDASYTHLSKGTFAKLQPLGHKFQRDVEDIQQVLEAQLMTHSTLSEGDILTVNYCDETYELNVLELRPEAQVSVIDTEIEVDVAPSVEYEEFEQMQKAAAARREAELAEMNRLRAQEELAKEEAAMKAAQEAADRDRRRAEKASRLPEEPAEDAVAFSLQGAISCVVRMPDGARLVRRMLVTETLGVMFDFVDANGKTELEASNLATSFPRRVYTLGDDYSKTLEEVGLQGPQIAFFLEQKQ